MADLTINTNISSLSTQRRLGASSAELNRVFERLSSGQRINRASDDAAGLAIASSLSADEKIFTQGVRNLNDGVSLLSIADGAIESLTNIVTRLQELAEQAANGTYGNTQRKALDAEAQALSKEYSRIAQSTEFNRTSVLNGNLGTGMNLVAGTSSILAGVGGDIGTGTVQSRVSFATGTRPAYVATGDFNGDGITDIVAADYVSLALSVMLGNGDGSFKARTDSPTTNVPYTVATADMNGDGSLDLLTADGGGNSVSVYLGNGDGTFKNFTSFAAGAAVRGVTANDLNGDGYMDLITADNTDSKVSVLLGNGNGTFKARTSFISGANPTAVKTGDFNGDGIVDIVSCNYSGNSLSVFIGNGNGSFKASVQYFAGIDAYQVVVADINNDGILDLANTDLGNGSFSVFIGNGNGTFKARVSVTGALSASGLTAADMNGDGLVDMIMSDASNATVNIFIGNGNGTFKSGTSFTTGSIPRSVAASDFNGDGVVDLVAGDFLGNSISVLIGNTQDGVGPLLPFDLGTVAGARQALPVFQNKIQRLAAQRGEIGAFQSRIAAANNVLQQTTENYAAAESQIRDADIALDAANMARGKILQQAGAAVLAQANQQPKLALLLLQTK